MIVIELTFADLTMEQRHAFGIFDLDLDFPDFDQAAFPDYL
jgi:hypothetical protein